jgi:photosystem II stability/assembly factor-like uncharacterized protein
MHESVLFTPKLTHAVSRSLFHVARSTVVRGLVAILGILAIRDASAQTWRVLGSVGEPVYSVFFFHDLGWPTVGLVGTDKALYRTTDAGATWSKVFTSNGKVQAIVMRDRDNGWIAVGAGTGSSSVYWTSNMGISWVALSNISGLADDITYNAKNNRLFVSFLTNQSSSYASSDLGLNWTPMGPNLLNGYAFASNGLDGIVTCWGGTGLYTKDGGVTWQGSKLNGQPFSQEIWKPTGLKGTRSFVAVDDNNQHFFMSTDGGANWTDRYTLPERMSGTLQGTSCTLYGQSTTQMWVTYDLTNWQPLGGPGNRNDTRFQIVQNFVFAGDDTGAVWRYYQPDLPPANINVSIDRPAVRDIKAIGCSPDTAWVTIRNTACDTQIVERLLIADSSVWKIQHIPMPDTLGIGDSIRIRLVATDPHPGTYASSVSLHWKLESWTGDTTFTLLYDVSGIRRPSIAPLAMAFKDRCTAIDTFLTVKNEQCDTVQLFRVSIDDTAAFHLNTTSVPMLLAPGESYKFPVHIAAKAKGTYTGKVTVTIHDLGFSIDTVITLTLTVKDAIPFKIPVAFTKDLGKVSVCGFRESSVAFANTACDTLTLLKAELVAPAQDFTLTRTPSLPLSLAPGTSDSLILHFETKAMGPQQVTVHFQFVLDGVLHDTSITVNATGAQTLEGAASVTSLTFAPINACESTDQTVYVRNLSCYTVQLTDLQLPTGTKYSIISPALPQTLAAGDSIAVTVRLTGSRPPQVVNEVLNAVLKDSTQDKIIPIGLAGTIKAGTRVLDLSTISISADSLEPCSTFSTRVRVGNLGICDSLYISNVSFTGGSGFAITAPGIALGVGDTSGFQLSGPTTSGLVVDGLIHITGPGIDTTIAVHLSVKHGGLPDAVVSAATRAFTTHSCDVQTLYANLHNSGCSSLDVASVAVSSSGSQYTLASPWAAAPFVVGADGDTTLTIQFDPAQSGDGTATLVVTMKDGTTRSIAFTATIVPQHQARLLLTLASGQITNPKAGIKTGALLSFADAVDPADGLTELRVILQLDQDFLTIRNITPQNGWTITPESSAAGTYQFLATRSSAASITAGDALADLELMAFVSKQMRTDMQLSAVHFMPNDPVYEKCTLSPLYLPISHVEFTLDPLCGDNTISAVLRGDPVLSIESINPNPASASGITVTYSTTEPAEISIVDAAGHTLKQVPVVVQDKTASLSTDGLVSGSYHLVLESSRMRVAKPFVIEK